MIRNSSFLYCPSQLSRPMGVSLHLKSLMDDRCTFGIQATDISIDKEGDLWEVELSEISGSETFIHLRNGERTIVGLLEMVRKGYSDWGENFCSIRYSMVACLWSKRWSQCLSFSKGWLMAKIELNQIAHIYDTDTSIQLMLWKNLPLLGRMVVATLCWNLLGVEKQPCWTLCLTLFILLKEEFFWWCRRHGYRYSEQKYCSGLPVSSDLQHHDYSSLAFPLVFRGVSSSRTKEKVDEVAETLGLANLLHKLTHQKQLSLLVVAWSKTM